MKEDWQSIYFNFVPYKDTNLSILSAIDDVQVLLDDHIVKTTTMKNSPFIVPFEKNINEWDHTLVNSVHGKNTKKLFMNNIEQCHKKLNLPNNFFNQNFHSFSQKIFGTTFHGKYQFKITSQYLT